MIEAEPSRLTDLFRPRKLFAALSAYPRFVVPTLIFVIASMIYVQLALGPVMGPMVANSLELSFKTESELERDFRMGFLAGSFFLPIVAVVVTSFAAWLVARMLRTGASWPYVWSLVSFSFLWIALGFLVKAALVWLTGNPEPPTNLAWLIRPRSSLDKALLAFTNPFLILAGVWTIWGILEETGHRLRSMLSGGVPWAVWAIFLAVGAGNARFAPVGPVSFEDWTTAQVGPIEVLHPPNETERGELIARQLAAFTDRLANEFEFTPRPIRVVSLSDHRQLEQATKEFLHVKVVGSIRGNELLFVETPGTSLVVSEERGLREAMRYVALMYLSTELDAPRWFVEGIAHVAVFPYTQELDREYQDALRRTGSIPFARLSDPLFYQTPEGPLMARGVVDFIGFHHGPDALRAIRADIQDGTDFRDALFAHTRMTIPSLESGWQKTQTALVEAIRAARPGATPPAGETPGETAPSDSSELPELQAFPKRH